MEPAGNPAALQTPAPAAAPPAIKLISDRTVTVKEAAYRLGKSEDSIRRWLRTHRLRGRQPGGRHCSLLVDEASVEEALIHPAGGG